MDNESKCLVSFKDDYVLVKLEGPVKTIHILDVSLQVLNSTEHRQGMSEIWEVSAADMSELDPDSIADLSKHMEQLWQDVASSRVAVVSTNRANLSLARLFREYYQRDQIKAFESFQEAESWVLALR
jgi:hypothetical protein